MSRKYELLKREKDDLCRIRALRDIPHLDIRAGDIGGYVEREKNLSQDGDCWVCGDAQVYGNAWVYGDARVCGNAQVCGDAWVYGDARVCGNAQVCGDAWVKRKQDLFVVTGLGSRYRSTTFFREPTKISVVCGCFCGTLEEFRKKVRETHGNNKYAREYELACQLAELHILEEEEQP